jgi:hypothetical protein
VRQHNLTVKQLHDHHDKDKQPNSLPDQGDAMSQAFDSAMAKSKQKRPTKGFLAKNKKAGPPPPTGNNQPKVGQEASSWKPSLRPLADKAAAVINSAASNKQLRKGLLNIAYQANEMQRSRTRGQNAIRNGDLR